MSKDLEVISHLVGSMETILNKLEVAISYNRIDETNKLKSVVLDISKKIREELK